MTDPQGASDQVNEQVFKNVMNGFNILTTSTFVPELGNPCETIGSSEVSQMYHKARDHLKSAKKEGNTIILGRFLEDDRYRVFLQPEGITERRTRKTIGPYCERTKKENPSELRAEREHWKSTYHLKQTTTGGAGHCGHHQASRLAKAKEWH